MNNNPVLALMENDSPDKFAEDVANAYFANPAYVHKILNEDCIESCVQYVLDNQRVEFDLSDLDLFNEDEALFSKPSRQRGKRKHDKKAVRRKGSTKRFRDRSRKWQSENHVYDVYRRGLKGNWNMRGRRLAETGEVSLKTSQRLIRDIEVDPEVQDKEETRTFTYADGFTLSMCMSKSAWEKEEEDDFSPDYNWSSQYDVPEFYWNDHYWDDKRHADANEDNRIELPAECQTWEFTPQELADFMQKLANATPEQRAKTRKFFQSL